ncbi:thioredoxin fold domain-containing protein [Selenihalanaerobacter shriftii]|uniref:Thioredoxin-related protein n=1 Tax=Selenihalanaerobacter shriftii TaxID=142842 RepID=A0A1T4PGC8_9FIRM|nr:thioredoxin fold domain-containing protein [Selenihalanaerobacter shriftii]SJZ89828.1 Thioredoxin-related protein [Selenihalanaerobacter shriftii]
MSNNKKVIILLLIVSLIGGSYVIKKVLKNDQKVSGSLRDRIKIAEEQNQPIIIYFTYSSDCCESTREYFDKFNNLIQQLKEKFNQEVVFVNVDIAVEDQSEKEIIKELSMRYGVKDAPSLLLLDNKKSKVGLLEGLFEKEEAIKLIQRVVQ